MSTGLHDARELQGYFEILESIEGTRLTAMLLEGPAARTWVFLLLQAARISQALTVASQPLELTPNNATQNVAINVTARPPSELSACDAYFGSELDRDVCEVARDELFDDWPQTMPVRKFIDSSGYSSRKSDTVVVPLVIRAKRKECSTRPTAADRFIGKTTCVITLDLAGRTDPRIPILVPRQLVSDAIDAIKKNCVMQRAKGGYRTIGLPYVTEILTATQSGLMVSSHRLAPTDWR